MKAPARRTLLAGSAVIALTTVFWPRHAPDSSRPRPPHARVPAPAEVAAPPRGDPRVAPQRNAVMEAGAATELDVERASESALVEAARMQLSAAPEQALALIAAADRRFGAQDEARRVLEIEALVKLERIGLSHARAERFYRAFPGSGSARRVEQLTGSHPRPWGPGE